MRNKHHNVDFWWVFFLVGGIVCLIGTLFVQSIFFRTPSLTISLGWFTFHISEGFGPLAAGKNAVTRRWLERWEISSVSPHELYTKKHVIQCCTDSTVAPMRQKISHRTVAPQHQCNGVTGIDVAFVRPQNSWFYGLSPKKSRCKHTKGRLDIYKADAISQYSMLHFRVLQMLPLHLPRWRWQAFDFLARCWKALAPWSKLEEYEASKRKLRPWPAASPKASLPGLGDLQRCSPKSRPGYRE